MRQAKNFITLSVLGLLVFAVVAYGQGSFGGLTGHITDPSGASVPNATVRVRNITTGVVNTTKTTSDGQYLVEGLVPARYEVRIEHSGFQTALFKSVLVNTATVSTLNAVLAVGASSQTVTVTASVATIQTSSPEIGTVMPESAILDLPISLGGTATIGASGRRQIESFSFLTPGVTGNQWEKSINGAPGMSQEILYDGVDAQNMGAPGFIADDSPPYESVSEFKVQNTSYPAEYGLGFGVENYTLKSGTDNFHGDLFEFVRNNAFDAAGFFSNTTPIPSLQQNEYGGTFGGPVILPHYNGRQKTFFFVSYSGFQLRGGLPVNSLLTVPSMQERAGDFSDYPFQIYNPATTQPDGRGGYTRQPFPGNIIPANDISRVARLVTSLLPEPELPGDVNNYFNKSYEPTSENDYSVKLDHIIGSKQHISFAYWSTLGSIDVHGGIPLPLDPGFHDTTTNAYAIRANYTDSIGPTLVNNLAFGYDGTSPTFCHFLPDPHQGNQTLKIPGVPLDAAGYPHITFTDGFYYPLGDTETQPLSPCIDRNYSANDNLSWSHGAHLLQFGGMFRLRQLTYGDSRNEAGDFNFSNLSTSLPDASNFTSAGNSYASFMLGDTYSASQYTPAPTWTYGDKMLAFYGQDSYKIRPKVTLSLGLRYELPFYPIAGEGGEASELNLSKPNPAAGGLPGALFFSGTGPGGSGTFNILGKNYHRALMPRTGLAYQISNDTVLRVGYGLYYVYPNYGRLNDAALWGSGYGFTRSVTTTNLGITPAMNLDSGFPPLGFSLPDLNPALDNGGQPTYVNSSADLPAQNQSWTVDIQRRLPGKVLVDLAYVGEKTSHLTSGLENIDQLNPSYLSLGNLLLDDVSSPAAIAAGIKSPYPGFAGSVAQALRPYPQFSGISDVYQPTGYSTYEALQLRVQRQFSSGLGFLLSYTFSKTLGAYGFDTFGDNAGGGGDGSSLNTYNQKLEKQLGPMNKPNAFVFSWVYDLPFGRGKRYLPHLSRAADAILGGWQINSIETYTSGTPIGVRGGSALPIFNYAGNRPNCISSNARSDVPMSNFDPAKNVYLNLSAFSQPGPFSFGTCGPVLSNVRTPAYYDEDFSLFKRFRFHENAYFELRAEAFDVFNRVDFSGPAANINEPSTFGVISSQANTPRVVQLALKLIF